MLNRLFGQKPPTIAQVEAQQAKLAQRREAIRQRLTVLDEMLVQAYGADEPNQVEAINSEYSQLERELSTLATVSQRLEVERTDAVKRQLVADQRAEYETLQGHVTAVRELNPRIQELRRQLDDALIESNQHRQHIRNLRNAPLLRADRRCREYRADPAILADIDAELRQLDQEFNDALQGSIAWNVFDALAITDAMPSLADASLKGK